MKLRFQVTGMTCAACSARVEKVSREIPGVERAEVNLLKGTMQVKQRMLPLRMGLLRRCRKQDTVPASRERKIRWRSSRKIRWRK